MHLYIKRLQLSTFLPDTPQSRRSLGQKYFLNIRWRTYRLSAKGAPLERMESASSRTRLAWKRTALGVQAKIDVYHVGNFRKCARQILNSFLDKRRQYEDTTQAVDGGALTECDVFCVVPSVLGREVARRTNELKKNGVGVRQRVFDLGGIEYREVVFQLKNVEHVTSNVFLNRTFQEVVATVRGLTLCSDPRLREGEIAHKLDTIGTPIFPPPKKLKFDSTLCLWLSGFYSWAESTGMRAFATTGNSELDKVLDGQGLRGAGIFRFVRLGEISCPCAWLSQSVPRSALWLSELNEGCHEACPRRDAVQLADREELRRLAKNGFTYSDRQVRQLVIELRTAPNEQWWNDFFHSDGLPATILVHPGPIDEVTTQYDAVTILEEREPTQGMRHPLGEFWKDKGGKVWVGVVRRNMISRTTGKVSLRYGEKRSSG